MRTSRGIAVISLIFITSCSATKVAAQKGGMSADESSSLLTRHAPYSLPLDAYAISPDQQRVIGKAQNIEIKRCMARLGLSYAPAKEESAGAYKYVNYRRYGLVDAAAAKQIGYHLPSNPIEQKKSASLSPEQKVGLAGVLAGGPQSIHGHKVPDGGCMGEMNRNFRKKFSAPKAADVAQKISAESYRDSLKRDPVKEAFSDWSHCMAGEGFSFADPIEALQSAKLDDPIVSSREKMIAQSDVMCKSKTRLIERWSTEESIIQTQMIERNKASLVLLISMHNKLIAAAEKINGGS
ncbi:hypothetical protein [Streptomyces griseorubiginosus]|uniref:hypothetical protein n=1 Tax=Streptomyces griseorubiginosus TaxID=67304 RepID=UPI0033DDD164